jgi:hypothetical protein
LSVAEPPPLELLELDELPPAALELLLLLLLLEPQAAIPRAAASTTATALKRRVRTLFSLFIGSPAESRRR